jgi:hypothetical protein
MPRVRVLASSKKWENFDFGEERMGKTEFQKSLKIISLRSREMIAQCRNFCIITLPANSCLALNYDKILSSCSLHQYQVVHYIFNVSEVLLHLNRK